MRIAILKDVAINDKQFNGLTTEYAAFIEQHTGIRPTFFVHPFEYKAIPLIVDADGDHMPTMAWRSATVKTIFDKYNLYGVDHVVLLVHRDNWVFSGIWGTNWSNIYHGYQVHLCRFDHKNTANSFGTLYHEMMHSFDALIKVHTGVDIHQYFPQWDKFCVHGGRPDKEGTTQWKYIRWKENTEALAGIAPFLRQAYAKRLELFNTQTGLMRQVISLATQLKALLNRKNGVPKW